MCIRHWIIAALIAINPFRLLAQTIQSSSLGGAKAVSLGKAYAAIQEDFWGLFYNPAGIAGLKNLQAGLHFEQRFTLKELSSGSMGIIVPFPGEQNLGLQAASFGFEAFRQNHLAISYSIKLVKKFGIGLRLNYQNLNIKNYGSSSTLNLDFGLSLKINNELSFGLYSINANRSALKTQLYKEELPSLISVGLAFKPTDKVQLLAELEKSSSQFLAFKGGIEYQANQKIITRLGVNNQPLIMSTGLGIDWESILIDLALSYHINLGFSPHISILYSIGK